MDGSQNKEKPGSKVGEKRPSGNQNRKETPVGKATMALMIPTTLAASVLVGAFVGNWLDDRFGTGPWLMLLFVVMGSVAGIRQTMQILKRIQDSEK